MVADYHQKANEIAFLPSLPLGLLSYSNPVMTSEEQYAVEWFTE